MIKTPFGNIKVLIDGKEFKYQEKIVSVNVPSVNENPVDASYGIVLPVNNNKSICCIVECKDDSVESYISTDERFFSLQFSKGDILMSIGAEDESDLFETTDVPNGVKYTINSDIKYVEFGVAWTLDVIPYDVRAEIASDPTYWIRN